MADYRNAVSGLFGNGDLGSVEAYAFHDRHHGEHPECRFAWEPLDPSNPRELPGAQASIGSFEVRILTVPGEGNWERDYGWRVTLFINGELVSWNTFRVDPAVFRLGELPEDEEALVLALLEPMKLIAEWKVVDHLRGLGITLPETATA